MERSQCTTCHSSESPPRTCHTRSLRIPRRKYTFRRPGLFHRHCMCHGRSKSCLDRCDALAGTCIGSLHLLFLLGTFHTTYPLQHRNFRTLLWKCSNLHHCRWVAPNSIHLHCQRIEGSRTWCTFLLRLDSAPIPVRSRILQSRSHHPRSRALQRRSRQ